MKNAALALIALLAAAGPAAAEDLAPANADTGTAVQTAQAAVPSDARWPSALEASAATDSDDAEPAPATESGPPTPIVPVAYTLGR